MKVGMILGIIGGVIALIIGAVGFGLSSIGGDMASAVNSTEYESEMNFYSYASVGLPIVGIIGAAITYQSQYLAAGLMGFAAVGIVAIFGFSMVSMVPAVLLAIAAIMTAIDKSQPTS